MQKATWVSTICWSFDSALFPTVQTAQASPVSLPSTTSEKRGFAYHTLAHASSCVLKKNKKLNGMHSFMNFLPS